MLSSFFYSFDAEQVAEQDTLRAHKDETRADVVSQTEEVSTSPTAHTIAELGAAPVLGAASLAAEMRPLAVPVTSCPFEPWPLCISS